MTSIALKNIHTLPVSLDIGLEDKRHIRRKLEPSESIDVSALATVDELDRNTELSRLRGLGWILMTVRAEPLRYEEWHKRYQYSDPEFQIAATLSGVYNIGLPLPYDFQEVNAFIVVPELFSDGGVGGFSMDMGFNHAGDPSNTNLIAGTPGGNDNLSNPIPSQGSYTSYPNVIDPSGPLGFNFGNTSRRFYQKGAQMALEFEGTVNLDQLQQGIVDVYVWLREIVADRVEI